MKYNYLAPDTNIMMMQNFFVEREKVAENKGIYCGCGTAEHLTSVAEEAAVTAEFLGTL